MFSRGKATSGEPICNGITALANPANVGVANSSSMIVPCMVNAWLYCSWDSHWIPGRASSARMAIASAPAMRKKTNDVIRYRCPIFLWSVVVTQETITWPGPRRSAAGTGAAGSVCVAMSSSIGSACLTRRKLVLLMRNSRPTWGSLGPNGRAVHTNEWCSEVGGRQVRTKEESLRPALPCPS